MTERNAAAMGAVGTEVPREYKTTRHSSSGLEFAVMLDARLQVRLR